MKDLKHIKMFNESEENLNISDVRSSNYSMTKKEGFYKVEHRHFTEDLQFIYYDTTIVRASSKKEAMKKLNDYLSTEPDGLHTAFPCESIEYVYLLEVLE